MSGMVNDDSETFRLDNLESEVVGGACCASLLHYAFYSFTVYHYKIRSCSEILCDDRNLEIFLFFCMSIVCSGVCTCSA
jgi:hypothetical protein